MDSNEHVGILYKVNELSTYKIITTEWNGRKFYNIALTQKLADNSVAEFRRQLKFIKCDPPENGDTIRIISGFESDYQSPKNKFEWIPVIIVDNYEKVESQKEVQEAAIAEYQSKVNANDIAEDIGNELPF